MNIGKEIKRYTVEPTPIKQPEKAPEKPVEPQKEAA